jgi:putative DNA primase/helicase
MATEINNTSGQKQNESTDHYQPSESARFWRLNSIEGLKMMQRIETHKAQDPEHLDTLKSNSAELAQLQAREDAVQARYARIFGRQRESVPEIATELNRETEQGQPPSAIQMEPQLNSANGQLAERIKEDLDRAQHRFGLQDPLNDAKYHIKTADEMVAKADELRVTRFQGYTADRQVSQISKVGDQWIRDDGKTLAEVQAGIDQESAGEIFSRAQLRAQSGQIVDSETDKKLALADATAFLRIQDPQMQGLAAVTIADNTREYPDYKTGLEVAYSGYLRNPPKISPIAEKVATLDALSTAWDTANEKNIIEPVPEKERWIDSADAVERAAQHRQRERDQLTNEQNRLGTLAEEKRIDVDNLSEKSTEQDAANDIAERTGNATDRQSQQITEQEKNRQVELMQQLHHQFRVSGDKFHFKDQPGQVAFKDKGERMVSASNDERVAKAMATMADAKGWKTIKVSGHPDFQREVWMEASLRGLEVRGFKPSEQDLKTLEGRREHSMRNIIEQDATGRGRNVSSGHQEQVGKASPQISPKKTVEAESRVFEGKVLEHGPANYNYDQKEKPNYFVKLATKAGEKTVWGIDLNRAMSHAKAKPGDEVKLEFKGKQPVTVEALDRDQAGKVVGKKDIATHRNTWEVQKSDKYKVVEAVAAAIIDSKVTNPLTQQVLKAAVGARLNEREQVGKVPDVPMYDKNAAKQQKQPEQISPQIQRTERTR